MALATGPVTSEKGHLGYSYQKSDIEGSYSLCADIDTK